MKLHRFFVKQPLGEEIELKEKTLLHQWNNVLKFEIGESLVLFNSDDNFDFIFKILEINKNFAKLKLQEKKSSFLQEREINLCIALIKKDNLDLVLEKCTELGVTSFTPIITERTEKKNIASFNVERSERIIIESVEQSGWGSVPVISESIKLENLLNDLEKKGELENVRICDIQLDESLNLYKKEENLKNIHLFIGPEGGWTENERKLFKKHNLKVVSFGKNTLRAETAAIVGSFEMVK